MPVMKVEEPEGEARGSEPRVVLITAPEGEASRELARALVARRLAACVNVLAGATSVYRWEGAVEAEPEGLLIAKTTAAMVPRIEDFLREGHPYEVPECVSLAPASVEARYLAWLRAEVGEDRVRG